MPWSSWDATGETTVVDHRALYEFDLNGLCVCGRPHPRMAAPAAPCTHGGAGGDGGTTAQVGRQFGTHPHEPALHVVHARLLANHELPLCSITLRNVLSPAEVAGFNETLEQSDQFDADTADSITAASSLHDHVEERSWRFSRTGGKVM